MVFRLSTAWALNPESRYCASMLRTSAIRTTSFSIIRGWTARKLIQTDALESFRFRNWLRACRELKWGADSSDDTQLRFGCPFQNNLPTTYAHCLKGANIFRSGSTGRRQSKKQTALSPDLPYDISSFTQAAIRTSKSTPSGGAGMFGNSRAASIVFTGKHSGQQLAVHRWRSDAVRIHCWRSSAAGI